MRPGSKINGYRLQYWMYAIVAKHLGRSVKIQRDSLHSRYPVNRHCMYLRSTDIKPEVMEQVILEILLASGYLEKKDGTFSYFYKDFDKRQATITLGVGKGLRGDVFLHVSPRVY